MLEKQFVPYELSFKLKELGFNEYCFAHYNEKEKIVLNKEPLAFYTKNSNIQWNRKLYARNKNKLCAAPLWQQAIEWLREEHNMDVWAQPFVAISKGAKNYLPDESYSYFIFKDGVWKKDGVDFLDFEEALEAALFEALKILKVKI